MASVERMNLFGMALPVPYDLLFIQPVSVSIKLRPASAYLSVRPRSNDIVAEAAAPLLLYNHFTAVELHRDFALFIRSIRPEGGRVAFDKGYATS